MRSEQGSVIVLVALSLVIVIGMLGLAMDAGQLYVTKQRAQAAADAAAQAGVMDMYNGATVPAGKCPTTGGSAACVMPSAQRVRWQWLRHRDVDFLQARAPHWA